MTVSGPGVRVGMRGCPVIVSNYDEISVFLMGALSLVVFLGVLFRFQGYIFLHPKFAASQ